MSGPRDVRQLGKSAVNAVLERVGRGAAKVQERKPLTYDLLESDDAYMIVFDAPGATSSDVDVRFLDGEVEVRIDRFREYHEGFEMRFPGRGLALDGRATLPSDATVDPDEASASLTGSGTLRIRIPKSGEARSIHVADVDESIEEADRTVGAESADIDDAADRDTERTTPDDEPGEGDGDAVERDDNSDGSEDNTVDGSVDNA